jgi:UDP-N-acetylmuramate--alanine ligase
MTSQGPDLDSRLTARAMMRSRVNHIHMVGVGGSGMSGIAEVLLTMGFTVTGSDISLSSTVQRLKRLGAQVFIGHGPDNVGGADVLVKSTAIPWDNPEVEAARERGVPVIPRAEMLAEIMRLRIGIAVAGTHGKTTTTSILATLFTEAGLDPTVIIGGRLNTFGSNARLGEGHFLIAEADESDGSFLCLSPIMSIVTNVDADHLDHYTGGLAEIDDAFVDFMNAIPFYGMNVVCLDDPGVARLLPRIKRPVLTYGLKKGARLRGEIVSTHLRSAFKIYLDEVPWGEANLAQPGRHNVLNALAAVGMAMEAGLGAQAILDGLSTFGGVGRRFEKKGERRGVLVVDDYGHHPAEIQATLATARACFPERRIVMAFQPHRFTRTQALFGDFCKAFEECDQLLLTEIYPASEPPIPGVSGLSLAQGIKQVSRTDVRFYPDFEAMEQELDHLLAPGDLLLTQGAGSIHRIGEDFLERQERQEQQKQEEEA